MTFIFFLKMIKYFHIKRFTGKNMTDSNLALTTNYIWSLPEWDYLVDETSKVFRLTTQEKQNLSNSNTAKIIATIPFEAGCNEPERTAIAHLCIYMAEIQGFQKYYSHLPSDDKDIFQRLAFISTFDGGDLNIINHGMNILALIMIEGYRRSESKDRKTGEYNPFVAGTWNYKQIKNKLLSEINKLEVPNLDCIFSSLGSWI